MEHEHLSYPEALKYLAKKYNIEIEEKELSAEEIEQKNQRESLLVVTEYAGKVFADNLHKSNEGRSVGLSYFRERGFREDIIQKFQLGYSLEIKDHLTQTAQKEGYKLDYLIKTGLTIQGTYQNYDRFSGRVMFPIHSLGGKVIGFGGRTLKTDKNIPKYLNSPESDIYHKSKILYGIYQAKNSILKSDKCFLVEGYTDVISMHQSGIENVLASSGTSLTVEQIQLIKRFTPNITIIYDGDEAGIKASTRGIDMILEEGMNVKVVLLPEGEDPDSFAQKHHGDEFLQHIEKQEEDFIHFKARLLMDQVKSDPVKKAQLITDIVRSIAVIPDQITRSVYIKECSNLLKMEEQVLHHETGKIIAKKEQQKQKKHFYKQQEQKETKAKPAEEKTQEHDSGEIIHEKELIRLLLSYGNKTLYTHENEEEGEEPKEVKTAEYIIEEITRDKLSFRNPACQKVFEECERMLKEMGSLDQKVFVNHQDNRVNQLSADLLSQKYTPSKYWQRSGTFFETEEDRLLQVVHETILSYKNVRLQEMLEKARQEFVKAQEEGDRESIDQLYQRFYSLSRLKMDLAKSLGERTILR